MATSETTECPDRANELELNLLLPRETLETPLWDTLLSGIGAALFPEKESPLVLTSKPVEIGELLGDSLERPWYQSIFNNLCDALFPPEQPPLQLASKPVEARNELDDALALPWYKSVFGNIRDALFPSKLPALELSSKPVAVADIWGFYDHKKSGVLASTAVHLVLLVLVIGASILVRRQTANQPKAQARVMPLSNDTELLVPGPGLSWLCA